MIFLPTYARTQTAPSLGRNGAVPSQAPRRKIKHAIAPRQQLRCMFRKDVASNFIDRRSFLDRRVWASFGDERSGPTVSPIARSAILSSRTGWRHDGTIRLRTMRSRPLHQSQDCRGIGRRAWRPHPVVSQGNRTTKGPVDAARRVSRGTRNAGGRCAARSAGRSLRRYPAGGLARSLYRRAH